MRRVLVFLLFCIGSLQIAAQSYIALGSGAGLSKTVVISNKNLMPQDIWKAELPLNFEYLGVQLNLGYLFRK